MDTIVSLGAVANSLASCFEEYPQYQIYKFGIEQSGKGKHSFKIEEQETPEEYESNFPALKESPTEIGDHILFIVEGSDFVSAGSLRLLKQLRAKEINILYIRGDVKLLNKQHFMHEKVVYSVLQEYTRSDVFKRMYIVHHPTMEEILENVSIREYSQKMNELVSSTLHMINVFDHTDPEIAVGPDLNKLAKICTLGIYDIEKNEEKPFFPIDNPVERVYYYGINEKSMNDTALYKKIRGLSRKNSTEDSRVSYGIYSTNYDNNFCYCIFMSDKIQK